MLTGLYIHNFALIEKLEIELEPGFNVLTGETGAGKSIIIDAVDVVIGGQGLAEYIRSGAEKAIVEAVFDISGHEKVRQALDEVGLLPDPDELLILSRELVLTGKNVCRINGRQVNLSVFREIAEKLVDIYGQHHQQSLLNPRKHIELLDEFGGSAIRTAKEHLTGVYETLISIQSKILELESLEKDRARMLDMYRYQTEEIEKTRLLPDEDISLEEEKNILTHSEKLAELCQIAYGVLYEGDRRQAVTELLYQAITAVKEACGIDEKLHPVRETLETVFYQLEEAARDIRAYLQKVETDPVRLEEIDNRLDIIRQLKRKYGNSIAEILKYKEQISCSLASLENSDEELVRLRLELAKAMAEYLRTAEVLGAARKSAALRLQEEIAGELKSLNMPHVTFRIDFSARTNPSVQGMDDVEFLISPNKGEPLKPMAKIVSGGEVSRIMLAFKTILADSDSVSTMIFDEVDAGIGGDTLVSVAEKLFLIGKSHQVICVTHSPQLAGKAATHFRITKSVKKDRTVTEVTKLGPAERIDEISRMLGGSSIASAARKHAEEILHVKD